MIATVVDLDALWQTVWTATLAGVGVTIVFSLGVLGATRSLDMRRDGRDAAAAAFAVLAALGAAATLGAIVYGIVLIKTK